MVEEVLPGAGRRSIGDDPPEIRLSSPRLNEPVGHELSAGRACLRNPCLHLPAMKNHLSSRPPCIEKSRTIAIIKIRRFTPIYPLQRPTEPVFSYLNKASRQLRRTPFQSSPLDTDDSNAVQRNLHIGTPHLAIHKSHSAHI
jgi:hypothetical protein